MLTKIQDGVLWAGIPLNAVPEPNESGKSFGIAKEAAPNVVIPGLTVRVNGKVRPVTVQMTVFATIPTKERHESCGGDSKAEPTADIALAGATATAK